MSLPSSKELLDAGVHFGHLKKKWNPKMSPYIFMERRGIHIIDLNKTLECMEKTGAALRQVARSGKKILFVATKKQARELVKQSALSVGMPFVTERWLGGMMTNFQTIRKSIKKMQSIDRMLEDGSLKNITKKERLMLSRDRDKMERVIGGITNLNRIPSAIFIVDISHEHIALAESKKLGVKTFAMVDTNSNPNDVDFAIPANDDASKSIAIVTKYITDCVREGLKERDKDKAERKSSGADEGASQAEGGSEGADGGKRRLRRRRKNAASDDAQPKEEVKAEAPAEVKTEAKTEAPATETAATDAPPAE